MPESTHVQLKTAVKIFRQHGVKEKSSISAFARNLIKPNGEQGVSHTAVIQVAKNNDDTSWLEHEILKLINEARCLEPDYFETETNFLLSKSANS